MAEATGFSDENSSLFLCQQKRTNKGSTILRLAKLCVNAKREGNPIGAGAIFFALFHGKKTRSRKTSLHCAEHNFTQKAF